MKEQIVSWSETKTILVNDDVDCGVQTTRIFVAIQTTRISIAIQPMLTALHGLGCCRLGPQYLCRMSARRDIGRPSIGSVHPMSNVNIWL